MSINKSFQEALENASRIMKADGGKAVEEYQNSVANHKEKRIKNAQTDILSTTNVGYGAEAMVEQEWTDELYSMVSEMPGLMTKLPANHGQKKGDTVNLEVIGEVDLFKTALEPTGAQTYANLTTDNGMATGKVPVEIKSFRSIFAISKKSLHDSIQGENRFYQTIQNRILLGLNRTLEAYIINGDPRIAETPVGSANVNFFDTDASVTMPADAYWLGGNKGIRAEAIDAGIVGGNVAFSRGQILNTMAKVPDYLDDYQMMLWILNGQGNVNARALSEYSTQNVFGDRATNTQGGRILELEGIETYTAKNMPNSVGVSGKVEVGGATANNFASLSLIHRYAPQYCFGRDMEIVVKEDSQRIFFDVSARFGMGIVSNKAGLGQSIAQLVYQK